MADDTPRDPPSKAAQIVKTACNEEAIKLSDGQAEALTVAVEQDLITLSDKLKHDEERLAKLETQTRVLSEAVVAITTVEPTVAPAIRAVQQEMHPPNQRAVTITPGAPGSTARRTSRLWRPSLPA